MLRFFNKRIHNRKGFTLIELIVVIAILAILALIAVPRLLGFTEMARQSTDEEAAAILANAALMYVASENIAADIVLGVADLSATDQEMVKSDIAFVSNKYATATGDIDVSYDADTGTVTVTGDSGTVFTK